MVCYAATGSSHGQLKHSIISAPQPLSMQHQQHTLKEAASSTEHKGVSEINFSVTRHRSGPQTKLRIGTLKSLSLQNVSLYRLCLLDTQGNIDEGRTSLRLTCRSVTVEHLTEKTKKKQQSCPLSPVLSENQQISGKKRGTTNAGCMDHGWTWMKGKIS